MPRYLKDRSHFATSLGMHISIVPNSLQEVKWGRPSRSLQEVTAANQRPIGNTNHHSLSTVVLVLQSGNLCRVLQWHLRIVAKFPRTKFHHSKFRTFQTYPSPVVCAAALSACCSVLLHLTGAELRGIPWSLPVHDAAPIWRFSWLATLGICCSVVLLLLHLVNADLCSCTWLPVLCAPPPPPAAAAPACRHHRILCNLRPWLWSQFSSGGRLGR